jgi:hypothetical protein
MEPMPGFLSAASLLAGSWKRWRSAWRGGGATGPAGDVSAEQRALEQLAAGGWRAQVVTPGYESASWVLAEKGSARCLVKTFLRDRPLSERTLREVIAARARLQATHAAVICPAGIAREARPTAKSAGIVLLRPGDLARLDRALGL